MLFFMKLSMFLCCSRVIFVVVGVFIVGVVVFGGGVLFVISDVICW